MTNDEHEHEDTIRELLRKNDREDLERMRREMQDLAEETDDDQEEDLLRFRLELVEDAIERSD